VDVPAYFLAVTGKAIGDTVRMAFAGRQIPVRIVGEIFDNQNNGLAMVTDWQTLASADPGLEAGVYDVGLRPGTGSACSPPCCCCRPESARTRWAFSARQTIAMVVCSVAGIGLAAGLAAIPAGIAALRSLVPVMGAAAGTGMPPSYLDVYSVAELAGLALAGVVIAVAGALLPATWAARNTTSSVLRAE
jgi:putative ABC transport system permease protein